MAVTKVKNSASVFPQLFATDADTLKRTTLGGNKTSSVADETFIEFRDIKLTPAQVTQLNDWKFRLEKSRDDIEMHFEKRAQLLFLQATLCYGTDYRFREGHTIHQGLNAKGIPCPKQKNIEFQAAHSATLPCLYARAKDSDQEVVFLYRSGFYDESQSTIDVIKAVNDADRAIDEKFKDSDLRNKAVKLLNKAAKKKLTPEEVSKEFSLALLAEIKKAIKREKNPEVKAVLEVYHDKAELLWSYTDSPDNIDRWLGLQLDDPMLRDTKDTIELLKQEIEVPRDDILKIISRKIDNLPVEIRHKLHQNSNESRAPFHFYDLYFYNLLKRFQKKDLRVVEEATGITFETLEAKVKNFSRVKKTNGVLAQNAKKIDALAVELQPLIAKAKGKTVAAEELVGLSSQKKVCLRQDIYRLRYQIIRADHTAQSVIKSKIESEMNAMKSKGTNHLETFFYWALLGKAKDKTEQQALCKLLNVSYTDLTQKVREIKTNAQAHAVLDSYAREVTTISAELDRACSKGQKVSTKTKEEISKRIEKIYKQMKSVNHTAPIKTLFYRRLFDQTMETTAQKVLAELLDTTADKLDKKITQLQKGKKLPAAEKRVADNAKKIESTAKLAFKEIDKLTDETYEFRRKLMVELRLSHGMSQAHFKDLYRTTAYISDGTMSNLETGKRNIRSDITGHLAEIFGVSESLFHPLTFVGG